jgi:hypothetical protein
MMPYSIRRTGDRFPSAPVTYQNQKHTVGRSEIQFSICLLLRSFAIFRVRFLSPNPLDGAREKTLRSLYPVKPQ